MAINIKVGTRREADKQSDSSDERPVDITFKLKVRRSLDGDYMITDHPDTDIVVKKDKIILFPKEHLNDIVYDIQDKFFRFMQKKGIVKPDTIRAGNVYGSMEAMLEGDEDKDRLPLVIGNIEKFINDERPYFEYIEKYKKMEDDEMLDPSRADSTDLGEVPQAAEKGGIRPGYGRVSPYFLSYML
tara:strand:- start:5617 stop:6174 length:558 start_codon:yes stop_codon:yes gene_type:complete